MIETSPGAHDSTAKTNILFFMTDEHHAGCLGSAGHPFVQTPNLDALAQRGAWFRNAFSCSAICAPSRTSFMSGTYLRTHNHFGNSGDLQRDLPHMVSEARKAGYRTGVCGKSHVPTRFSSTLNTHRSVGTTTSI